MLRRDTGQYLFEHTVRNVAASATVERVVLATDSEEILRAAEGVGIEALLTAPEHPSGTDRVHEAHQRLRARDEGPWDVVVNVQGDEPELPTADLDVLVEAFDDPDVELATLAAEVSTLEEARDPAVVKVVTDTRGDALYFSRSPIPSLEHPSRPMRPGAPGLAAVRRHVGVYAFRPAALERFCTLPAGRLETTESLEQLRWIEAGGRIRVLAATQLTVGIDTEEHYAAFRERVASSEGRSSDSPTTPTAR
jgi:3-deoxy-manno-octulosonate cytidylyltransferase (CMP-KDO synthetase)